MKEERKITNRNILLKNMLIERGKRKRKIAEVTTNLRVT